MRFSAAFPLPTLQKYASNITQHHNTDDHHYNSCILFLRDCFPHLFIEWIKYMRPKIRCAPRFFSNDLFAKIPEGGLLFHLI